MWSNSLKHTFFAWTPQPAANPPTKNSNDYLGQQHFVLVIFTAFMLHVMIFWIWGLLPKAHIIDIPVRVLNIKLGDEAEETAIAQPMTGNKSEVENTISRLVRDQEVETQARAQAPSNKTVEEVLVPVKNPSVPSRPRKENIRGKIDVRQEGVSVAAPVMPVETSSPTQFVRSNNTQADLEAEVAAAAPGSAREAEMVARYEQLISMWIQKFKVYPEEARGHGMQGETVVRIRIDRQGNIRYQILERSTGHKPLDRAAIDMIRRANPVPAVPTDYPAGDLFEFLVPVTFHLQ